ncbi:hypothetical protein [Nocardioides sp. NPDC047086]|uniref:WXG100 family type VII secretion target n=1 Tax=Nocardioides sp. NPDC047086 TaxID=3154810 RepID=UPI0033E604D5
MKWRPERISAAGDALNTLRKKTIDQQDEMSVGKVPGTWMGASAERAKQRYDRLHDGLNDIAAPLSQVRDAVDEAAGEIKSAQRAAESAHEAIRGKGYKIITATSDMVLTEPPPAPTGKMSEDEAKEAEERAESDKAQVQDLQHELIEALRKGEQADMTLNSVLTNAATNRIDGGEGSIRSAALPPELRGLSTEDLTKKVLADPELLDDTWDALPASVQAEVGDYTARKIEDIGAIDSVAERKEAEKWFDLVGKYSSDRDFGEAVLDRMGPEGVNNAIHNMTGWSDESLAASSGGAAAMEKLQRTAAGNLAELVGTGTRGGWVDDGKWAKGIGKDWQASTILLHAAEQRDVELGGDFTGKLGAQLIKTENGDPLAAARLNHDLTFGGESFGDQDGDAIRQLVKVADNGIDSAQGLMGDEDVAKYLLHDREGAGNLANVMDNVVRVATIDAAMEPGEAGKNAADLASWTVDYAAKVGLDDHYDEELGGILGTYIADTYQGIDEVYPIDPPVPPNHAVFDKADLQEVLHHIGDNKTAVSILGEQSGKLNQLIIDEGARESLAGRASGNPDFHPDTGGDPLMQQISRASGIRGFLEDELSQGLVDEGKATAEQRRKVAELFALPTKLIPVGDLGALGGTAADYLIGEVRQQVVNNYVGDPVHSAAVAGNENYESARRATELQALYAVAVAEAEAPPGGDLPTEVAPGTGNTVRFDNSALEDWPRDDTGRPKAPGALSPNEMAAILDNHRYESGINGAVSGEVRNAWDQYQAAKSNQGE